MSSRTQNQKVPGPNNLFVGSLCVRATTFDPHYARPGFIKR